MNNIEVLTRAPEEWEPDRDYCQECGCEIPPNNNTDMMQLCDECAQNPPDIG